MLPNPSMLPYLVAHLLVCATAGSWLWRRAGAAPSAAAIAVGVAQLLGVGLALGPLTAPPGAGEGGFALLLAWSWTLCIVLPTVLLAIGIALLFVGRRAGCVALGLGLLGVIVTVDGFVVEPHALQVSRHTLRSDRVRAPLRIAVIADLQTDAPASYEADALRAVMAEHPDVVLMPGDFIQHADPLAYAAAWAELRGIVSTVGLSAPLGVFAMQGDVDAATWTEQLWGGVEVVHGDRMVRDDVRLVGLDVGSSRRRPTVERHDDAFVIVAGHAPDFALGDIDADLLLAGHTHGGQVRLPLIGPLLTLSEVPRAWAAGRTEIDGNTTLIVSRGVGMERGAAPRVRLFCRPEIVIVDVVPAD